MSENGGENDERSEKNVPERLDNVTHVRTDSAFSVDSFILEAKPTVSEDLDEADEGEKVVAQNTYDEGNAVSNPNQEASKIPHSPVSTDSVGIRPPSPEHNFFKKYTGNESDEVPSDGSIVFNYTPPPAVQSMARNDRSRFPSFDSVGSSGSLVQKAAPPRSANAPKTPSAAAAPPKPKILPYNERKRMQQRQAQQKEQQQKPPAPPSRPPPSPSNNMQAQPPFVIPNQPFPPSNAQSPHMYPPFPPPQAYGIPSPPHHNFAYPPPPGMPPNALPPYPHPPPHHHGAYQPIPPVDPRQQQQQQYTISPIPPYKSRSGGLEVRPPTSSTIIGGNNNRATTPRPRQHQQQPGPYGGGARLPMQLPPPSQPLPPYQRGPVGAGRAGGGDLPWNSSSSFDSSEAGRQQRRRDLPPPPPPPPPPPATHIRQESSGSVSSLGSQDRGSGLESEQQQQQQPKKGFFQRISSPWKTTVTNRPEPTVSDFHRKNQAFLSKIERQNSSSPRSLQNGSPGLTTRR